MQITEVKVFPVEEEKLRAFVSIVLDNCFMVNDIKVIQGKDGLFISMPSRKKRNGKFKDVAHPLNNETRKMLEDQILSEYDRVRSGQSAGEEREAGHPRSPDKERERLQAAEPAADESLEKKSLEEVAEMHLRDSFWNP
jgi:stage V sporulation protein G